MLGIKRFLILALCALTFVGLQTAHAENVKAELGSDQEAPYKCPNYCAQAGMQWNGTWHRTVHLFTADSVCGCSAPGEGASPPVVVLPPPPAPFIPSSCSVGDSGNCGGCSITCSAKGQQATCQAGTDSGNQQCTFQSRCYCW